MLCTLYLLPLYCLLSLLLCRPSQDSMFRKAFHVYFKYSLRCRFDSFLANVNSLFMALYKYSHSFIHPICYSLVAFFSVAQFSCCPFFRCPFYCCRYFRESTVMVSPSFMRSISMLLPVSRDNSYHSLYVGGRFCCFELNRCVCGRWRPTILIVVAIKIMQLKYYTDGKYNSFQSRRLRWAAIRKYA